MFWFIDVNIKQDVVILNFKKNPAKKNNQIKILMAHHDFFLPFRFFEMRPSWPWRCLLFKISIKDVCFHYFLEGEDAN